MTQQMALSAELAADEAIARVERGAPASWMSNARYVIYELCVKQPEFTTDDVWDVLGQPPEPRAMGAVMRQVTRKGYCVGTDRYIKSKRRECHARPVKVWRSKLYR